MVDLNWTTEVLMAFISTILGAIAVGILVYRYRKMHERHVIWFLIAMLSETIYVFTEGLAYLLLSIPLFLHHSWAFVVFGFTLSLALDSISQDKVDALKMSIWTGIVTAASYLAFQPDSLVYTTFPNGERTIATAGMYRSFIPAVILFPAALSFYYMVKIHQCTPRSLRKYSALGLLSGILVSIVPAAIFMSDLSLQVPGVHMVSLMLGALLMAIAFTWQPRLAFILPFKALRLMAMDKESGIPIFTHDWIEEGKIADEMLFSGLLTGISTMMAGTIQSGDVQEIKLKSGVLLLYRNPKYPIVFVLVASQPSATLRQALNGFSEMFCEKYSKFFSNMINMEIFRDAATLVEEWFAYIPSERVVKPPK
jgi:hypothetical protein